MSSFPRREILFAAGAILAAPFIHAQERLRRIGCLFGGSSRTHSQALDAFRVGLKDHGWIEGRNVTLELHWAEGKMDRLASLAADLVRSKPDVIVTAAAPIVAEVKRATQTIPIVMVTGADPVEMGLVASLARPGGNLTGLSGFYESTPSKMLELAAGLVQRGAHIAALLQTNTPFSRGRYRDELERTAKTLDLRIEVIDVTTAEDVRRVLKGLAQTKLAALIVLPGPMLFALGEDLVRHAEPLLIPVIYPFEEMVDAGGLMSYAANLLDNYRHAARYVDRILRGANAGELPMEQPTRLWLAVNLRTAKAQGIRVPQSILQRADRVIE